MVQVFSGPSSPVPWAGCNKHLINYLDVPCYIPLYSQTASSQLLRVQFLVCRISETRFCRRALFSLVYCILYTMLNCESINNMVVGSATRGRLPMPPPPFILPLPPPTSTLSLHPSPPLTRCSRCKFLWNVFACQ